MIFRLLLTNGISGVVGKYVCWQLFLIVFTIVIMTSSYSVAQTKYPPVMIDMVFGEPVPMNQALDDMATARIVYLGEHHTVPRHHKFQLEIIKGLVERGLDIAIGMEMFSIEQQGALTEWLQSGSHLDELIIKLGKERWNNLNDYAGIMYFARQVKSPIICLNAPDALVRKVAKEGLGGLDESQLESVPKDVNEINPQYERLLRLKLRVHKSFQEKKLDRIILAQAVRDSVMARSAVDFLKSDYGAGKTMIIVAGSGHLNYGFGIPEKVGRHFDAPYRIALPSESGELVLTEQELRHAVPVEITHNDLSFIKVRIADYLSVLPLREDESAKGVEMIQAGIQ